MSGDRETRRRLEALESQTAFQEELLARLDEIVARQDGEIMEFRRQLRGIAARLKDVAETVRQASAAPDPADETPPHY